MSKGTISKPMQVVALRLSEDERARLQTIADEHGVTLSWILRQGARLYADDLATWLEGRKGVEGLDGRLSAP